MNNTIRFFQFVHELNKHKILIFSLIMIATIISGINNICYC